MAKIIGNTTATPNPQPNWEQHDATKADYIKNKPEIPSINGLATETYVDNKIANLVDSSPDALNTLNELAEALGDDPNFATTVLNELGNKVDKINGKGLSSNDYTTKEKAKLNNIEDGAQVNVQSDWNQSNETKADYIKNKPTIDMIASEVVDVLDLDDLYTKHLAFTLNDDKNSYVCTGFKSDANISNISKISIPEKIDGIPVTIIGENAFKGNTTLETVVLPDGLIKIKVSAFEGCTNLKNLYIPSTTTSVGRNAFKDCNKLISTTNGIDYIGKWAISGKNATGSLEIKNGIVGVAENFCNDNQNITSVTIPESVLYVGNHAFSNCLSVDTLNIYSKDITINKNTFVPMHIKNADIPTSMIPGIEKGVLETLVVNNGDKIPVSAFKGCTTLKNITLPETLTFIGKEAFGDCFSILNVKLPSIEMWCNVEFEDGFSNPVYYIQPEGNIYFGEEVLTNLVIPRTVTELKNNIFYGYQKLKTVKFEENSMCSRIGDNAFGFCRALTSIEMPNSVIEIGLQAFIECTSLTTITIPDGVETIGYGAFKNCNNLTSVIMGKSIRKIYEQAFGGCTAIKDFYLTDIRAWATVELGDAYSSPLYYANGDMYYISAIGDITKIETLIIPNSVNKIKQYTFQGSLTLKEIVIPESVDTIEYSAFCYDRNIATIYLPLSLKTIEATAFDYCTGIKTVYYAGSSTQWNSIDIEANNNNLTSASRTYNTPYKVNTDIPTKVSQLQNDVGYAKTSEIPTKISKLENDAGYAKKSEIPCVPTEGLNYSDNVCYGFEYTNLNKGNYKKIVIASEINGSTITKISTNAFTDCYNLQEIVIPESINFIDAFAFEDCDKITSITLPKTLAYIGYHTFAGCSNLQNIYISDNVTFIDQYAFDRCYKLTIYCEAKEPKENWQEGWNGGRPVIYNQKPATQAYVDETINNIIGSDVSNFITEEELDNRNYAKESDIPTNVSELVNDAGYAKNSDVSDNYVSKIELDAREYATKQDIPEVPTKVSELVNDADFISQSYVDAQNANTLAVAEGKNKSFVCDNIDNMIAQFGAVAAANDSYTFNLPEAFTDSIKTGDVILIKDINVPDYWISTEDGKTGNLYILETTKVDLTDYETSAHAQATYSTATNLANGKGEYSIQAPSNQANHSRAMVLGYNNKSCNDAVLICGKYCREFTPEEVKYSANQRLFMVGNGFWTNDASGASVLLSKNAFEVLNNGDAYLEKNFYAGGSVYANNNQVLTTQAEINKFVGAPITSNTLSGIITTAINNSGSIPVTNFNLTNGQGANSIVHGPAANGVKAAGPNSVVLYSGNTLKEGGISIGQNTLSAGHACFSQGWECYAGCSTPAGDAYLKNGDASKLPTDNNRYCTATGIWTAAVLDAAFSTGRRTTAYAMNTFSGGYGTYAEHTNSASLGYGTITGRNEQLVIGTVNAIDNDALFVIGNGTKPSLESYDENGKMICNNRKNAFVVKSNGNVEMGNSLKIGNTTISETQLQQLLNLINQ